jgi:hypothetical protein
VPRADRHPQVMWTAEELMVAMSSSAVDLYRVPLDRRHKTTVGLELFTGAAALAGGVALAAKPDGSLLHAQRSALSGSPFTDWRVPGLLLATLVGGGALLAGISEVVRCRHARALSLMAGAGLVAFECVELAWLGFQPLEAVFAGVGVGIVVLRRSRRPDPIAPSPRGPQTRPTVLARLWGNPTVQPPPAGIRGFGHNRRTRPRR